MHLFTELQLILTLMEAWGCQTGLPVAEICSCILYSCFFLQQQQHNYTHFNALVQKGISTFLHITLFICRWTWQSRPFLVILMPTVQFNGNNYICFFFLLNAMGYFWLLTYHKVNAPLALYKSLNISPVLFKHSINLWKLSKMVSAESLRLLVFKGS